MKLQKFTKNRKVKTIFIGSIVGILLLIGGISLYRTFALYKIEKTFNVLEGTIPYFSKEYKEKLLNGADPVLDEKGELVPVKIGNNGEVTKADVAQPWYSYANKEWANAVILTDTGKNKEIEAGDTISETDIESYFVWIPKYRYKLFDEKLGMYETATSIQDKSQQAIEIEFGLTDTVDDESKEEYKQCKTPMNDEGTQGLSGQSGECNEGDWMTHPAFISFKANGLWVGKFEASQKSNTTPQIKPNFTSWTNITVANSFYNSYNYKRNLDSHMMKNTEWGAVAYLTQSIYGRCSNDGSGTICTEVALNENSSLITGYTGTTTAYSNSQSVASSTTNNYSGIYDMNKKGVEYVMGVMYAQNQVPIYLQSGFTTSNFPKEQKYFDAYIYGGITNYTRRILGDATGELGPFQLENNVYKSSYFGDSTYFVEPNYSWFRRGNPYGGDTLYGIFAFNADLGLAHVGFGFRIVLAPQ